MSMEMRRDVRKDPADKGQGFAHGVIIYLVALILTLPLFILVYPHLPRGNTPRWGMAEG